jgi:magnesium transporter
MTRYLRRRPRHVGAPPGTITIGDSYDQPFTVQITRYAPDLVESGELESGSPLPEAREGEVLWVDLVGHTDIPELTRIARFYGISPLVIEDAVDVGQRPKLDLHGDGVFLSLRSISILPDSDELRREQIGLFFREGLVVSFQEVHGDVWSTVRRRIAEEGTPMRASGADFLWYSLVDATVDAYYLVLDRIAEGIEGMEEDIFESLPSDTPQRLRVLRKEAVALRRAAWPLREATDGFVRIPEERFGPNTLPLLEDVRDHVRQVAEVNELMREAIKANMDTYLSLVGVRQNEIMKVLTLVATIFIPLTFIAGIYGMNFEVMPELGFRYGYPMVWAVMVAVTIGMLLYFKRRNWL